MAIAGEIPESARSELPETWDKLVEVAGFGEPALVRRLNAVMDDLFGSVLDEAEQAALDSKVVEYAGKLVALRLITPGIDFWKSQTQSVSATGRNETKSYGNRADALKELRKYLLEETRKMWPDVKPLVPNFRTRVGTPVPVVRDVEVAHTPNPFDFEPPYGPPETT